MPELRVASYNIHGCIGTDRKYSPERIREVLMELDARIIVLQEVQSTPEHQELMAFLTRQTCYSCIEGPTLLREAGQYGNAIITSLPVTDHRLLDISFRQREPRGAVCITTGHEGRLIRIIGTHLGLTPAERRTQVQQLLAWMGPPAEAPEHITLLMGDLNEWFQWGRPLRWLRAWFGSGTSVATYPTCLPMFALDRIWVHPPRFLLHTRLHKSALARIASDHYPVIATLRW